MNRLEVNILALKYMEGLKDESLTKYKEDLIFDLVKKHEVTLEDFSDKYITSKTTEKVIEKDIVDYNKLSKIEKIKYKNKNSNVEGSTDYYKLAFINEKKDEYFVAMFDTAYNKKDVITDKEHIKGLSDKKIKKYIKKKEKEYDNINLGIDKIIILDPTSRNLHRRFFKNTRTIDKDLIKSEKRELELNEVLKSSAEKFGIDYSILCKEEYSVNSIESFNEEALIKEWLSEYAYYCDYRMIPFSQNRINYFTKKYGTNYLLVSKISSIKYRLIPNLFLMYFLILPEMIPYMVYSFAKYKYKNIFSNVILDMESLEIIMLREREINKRINIYNIKSIVYDMMYQIKNENK